MTAPRQETKETPLNIVILPYINSKTSISDLKENLKLYDEKEIASIRSSSLNEGRNKKTALQGINRKYWDVIKDNDNYYAIYKGKKQNKHLGKGGYGFTKLAQNLKTGDWLVLKVIDDPHRSQSNKNDFEAEKNGLKLTNQLANSNEREVKKKGNYYVTKDEKGSVVKEEYKTKHQFEILIRLAPGVPLNKIRESKRTMPTARWLDLGISALEAVKYLHDNNMLHCDIKTANMMYDPASRKVTLIDFGLAVDLKPGEDTIFRKGKDWGEGSVYYMAPECANGLYSRKSDVFSLGIMLAEMYNLGKQAGDKSKEFNLFSEDSKEGTPRKISPDEVRRNVTDLVRRMLSFDPHNRPTLDEALNQFKEIRGKLLDTPALLTRTGYLNIQEFRKGDFSHQNRMIDKLKEMDEVFLIDDSGLGLKEYLEIKRDLEAEDIIVRQDVLQCQGMKPENVIRQHIQQRKNEDNYIYDYTYILKDKYMSVNITPYMMSQEVIKSLQREYDRLKDKYQNNPNAVKSRLQSINFHIQKISQLQGKDISYENIQNQLQILQNKLLSRNVFKRFFEKNLGVNTTESLKIVRELGQEVKNATTTPKPK